MKIKKNKKLIKSIISIFITLLMLFSFVVINYNIEKKTQDTSGGILDYYFFESGVLDKDNSNYDYKLFKISDPDGLRNFAQSVSNGLDFKGKEVCLTKDIDMLGTGFFTPIGMKKDKNGGYTDYNVFKGLFNGNNYTIHNLSSGRLKVGTCSAPCLGFFSAVGDDAIIRSVKIDGISFYFDNSTTMNMPIECYVGGIAGLVLNSATIKSCIVEGFNITGNVFDGYSGKGQIHVGGIVGATDYNCKNAINSFQITKECDPEWYNYLQNEREQSSYYSYYLNIRDCYLEEVEVSTNENSKWNISSIGPSFAYAHGLAASSISDPVWITIMNYENVVVKDTIPSTARNTHGERYHEHTRKSENNAISFFKMLRNKQDIYTTNTKAIENLSTNGEWYAVKSSSMTFNDGWPYLRYFLEFNTFKFQTDGNGSLTGDQVSVPTNAVYNFDETKADQEFCGLVIKVVPDEGYHFKGWSRSESDWKIWIAHMEGNKFKITALIVYPDELTEAASGEIEKGVGETINISAILGTSQTKITIVGGFDIFVENKYVYEKCELGSNSGTSNIVVPSLGDNGTTHILKIYVQRKIYNVEGK